VMLRNAEQCEPSPESHWVLNTSPECGPILNASPECDPVLNEVHIRDAHECRDVCTLSVRMDRSIHSLRSIDWRGHSWLVGPIPMTAGSSRHKERHRVSSRTVVALLVVEKRHHLDLPVICVDFVVDLVCMHL